jgi:hypothetical protein
VLVDTPAEIHTEAPEADVAERTTPNIVCGAELWKLLRTADSVVERDCITPKKEPAGLLLIPARR